MTNEINFRNKRQRTLMLIAAVILVLGTVLPYVTDLEKHTQQFIDDIAMCPNWTLVDFYIDKGMTAPRMENSKEWCRLLGDCFSGKDDMIIVLGDVGINYYLDSSDDRVKKKLSKYPCSFFFIQDNKRVN